MMRKFIFIFIILILALSASAQEPNRYFSHVGRFYVEIPSDWEQVDYQKVDFYLSRYDKPELFDYDAVLAPADADSFFNGDYTFITLEKYDSLASSDIEHRLSELSRNFHKKINYTSSKNFLNELKDDIPSYNKNQNIVAVMTVIKHYQNNIINLLILKFFDDGVVYFYNFSPEKDYPKSFEIFKNMINSFSTKNFDDLLPKEDVKIADIDIKESTDDVDFDDEDSDNTMFYIIPVLLLFILIIARKRKSKKS